MTLPTFFTPTVATNVSGTVDGTAAYPSAGATTFLLGGGSSTALPNRHVHLRFDVAASIAADDFVWGAILFVKLSAKGGSGVDIGVWGSEFGASMANADYNLDESNSSPVRQYIGTILTASASVGDVGYLYIPSQFISKGAGGVCDLELRPANGATYDFEVSNTTDTMTIHGSTASGSGYTITPQIDGLSPAANPTDDKPRLMVLAYTPAQELARVDCIPAIGDESYLSFDIQPNCYTPVKGDVLLDILSTGLDVNGENLTSASLRRERMVPVKQAIGGTAAGGAFSFEVTPEKCTKLLMGFMKRTNTTGPSTVSKNGTDYDVYTHTFKPAQTNEVKYFTFIQKIKDDVREVYVNSLLDSLTFSVGVNNLITVNASVISEDMEGHDTYSAGENDENILKTTAAYDTYAPLSYVGTQIEKDGNVFEKISNLTLTIANNAGPTRVLRRKRGPKHIYPGKLTVAVSFDMYFEDLNEIRSFLGISHKDFPYKAEKDIQFDEMEFKFAGELGEAIQEYTFRFPKMMYQVISKSVNGAGPIMLSATAIGVYDVSAGANLVLTLKNTEEAADFADSSTKITVRPIERA